MVPPLISTGRATPLSDMVIGYDEGPRRGKIYQAIPPLGFCDAPPWGEVVTIRNTKREYVVTGVYEGFIPHKNPAPDQPPFEYHFRIVDMDKMEGKGIKPLDALQPYLIERHGVSLPGYARKTDTPLAIPSSQN